MASEAIEKEMAQEFSEFNDFLDALGEEDDGDDSANFIVNDEEEEKEDGLEEMSCMKGACDTRIVLLFCAIFSN